MLDAGGLLPRRARRYVRRGTQIVLACSLSAWGCNAGGSSSGEGTQASESEAETSTATTGSMHECEPWPQPAIAMGRGDQLELRFVDDSGLLGDSAYFPGLWPLGCPLEGEGTITPPCSQELQAGGAAAEDLDGDGDIDLVLAVLEGPDLWLRNTLDEGVVGFEPWSAVVDAGPTPYDAWRSSGLALFDYDGDGDLDAYMSSIGQPNRLLENLGGSPPQFAWRDDPSNMQDAPELEGYAGFSAGVGDYDRDGAVDLYTSEWRPGGGLEQADIKAKLFRNEGGSFVDRTVAARAGALAANPGGIWLFAPTFADLDDDGWPDLALVADNHTSKLLFNDHEGAFDDETFEANVNVERSGMGSTFGDFDGDGHLDWYVTAIYDIGTETCPEGVCSSGNRLYMNRGPRCFEEVSFQTGVHEGGWGWGAAAFDMDNDGDLDLVETNGFRAPYGPPGNAFVDRPMRAWINRGIDPVGELGQANPRFVDAGVATGLNQERGQGRGLLTLDYDGDGDLDLLVTRNGGNARLLRNEGGEQNCSLRVRVRGNGQNTQGLNAKVRVRRDAADGWQVREVGVRQGFLGQSPNVAHFGLGPADELEGGVVAELEVTFLGDDTPVRMSDVPACGEIVVTQP